MSTTTNPGELPDIKELERLANEFFAALPGGLAKDSASGLGTPAKPVQQNVLLNQGNVTNMQQPQTSLHDPHFSNSNSIPGSVAGSGISPSASNANAFDIRGPKTTLPDSKFASQGVVPMSVAGSGISPSVLEHGKTFNVNNPQTSFADPHLTGKTNTNQTGAVKDIPPVGGTYAMPFDQHQIPVPLPGFILNVPGNVPVSLPGLGISPGGLQNHLSPGLSSGYSAYLPFATEQPYESELREVLNGIYKTVPGSSLAKVEAASFAEPSFYFLGAKNFPGQLETTSPLSTHYITLKENQGVKLPLDANVIKRDFPILQERVNGKPLIWLDNAATTQKPRQVIERISYFYEHENSNIHRAAHELAARATDAYEGARKKVQQFLNASSPNEIIFVRGATEAINLVAKSWGEQNLRDGDEIILSHLEHHANIVPWQQLAMRKGLKIRVIPVDDDGQVLLDEYSKLLGPRTRLVSFTQVSNALGTVTPAKQMVAMAHQAGAKVLVDGAQSVSHMAVDVQSLNCDWFVFSGHKVFGPTGIGVVYGKEALLNETDPWQGGGNMIVDVTFEHTKYHQAPGRFEAGTGNIADAVGLGAAIDYVSRIGMDLIHQYEHYLLMYATRLMKDIPGLTLIGTAVDKASVLSFVFEGFRTEEVGVALNQEGIAVRAGHHCAQPILRRFGVESTVRPSLAFYNTCADIDTLVAALYRLRQGRGKK